jgi:hypothetical protein
MGRQSRDGLETAAVVDPNSSTSVTASRVRFGMYVMQARINDERRNVKNREADTW